MNRMRVAASSRDASLRAAQRKLQEALIAPNTAAEEHAAELAQGPEAAHQRRSAGGCRRRRARHRRRCRRLSEATKSSRLGTKKAPPERLRRGFFLTSSARISICRRGWRFRCSSPPIERRPRAAHRIAGGNRQTAADQRQSHHLPNHVPSLIAGGTTMAMNNKNPRKPVRRGPIA